MEIAITALVSCLPLLILGAVVLLLSWKSRGKIEEIECSAKGFKIRFGKSGRTK